MQIMAISASQGLMSRSAEKNRFPFIPPVKDAVLFSGGKTVDKPLDEAVLQLQDLSILAHFFEPDRYKTVDREMLISRIRKLALENEIALSKALDYLELEKEHFKSSERFEFYPGRLLTINPNRFQGERFQISCRDDNVQIHAFPSGLLTTYITGLQLLCADPAPLLNGQKITASEWKKLWEKAKPVGDIGELTVKNRARVKTLLEIKE